MSADVDVLRVPDGPTNSVRLASDSPSRAWSPPAHSVVAIVATLAAGSGLLQGDG
jgi:hypothetical protein